MLIEGADAGRLLVVDDNRVNRLLLGRTLEQQGHSVAFAADGRRALEILATERFNLILLDVEMPELDGVAMLKQLAAEGRLLEMPVIMTSALDEVERIAECIGLGADDFLSKPVNPVLLKARVAASLTKKRSHDQERLLMRRFATDEVVDDLARSGFAIGGSNVEASILFCDIRGFTPLCESQPPNDTIELLNTFYTLMFDAVDEHGGLVSMMAGDGFMAVFGAPHPVPITPCERFEPAWRCSTSSDCSPPSSTHRVSLGSGSASVSPQAPSSPGTRAPSTGRRTPASETS